MYKIVHRQFGQLAIWLDNYIDAIDLLELCRMLNPEDAKQYYMRRISNDSVGQTNDFGNKTVNQAIG